MTAASPGKQHDHRTLPASDRAGSCPDSAARPAHVSPLLRRRRRTTGDLSVAVGSLWGGVEAGIERDYSLGEVVGRGACGLVRRAVRLRDGLEVAVKSATLGPDPETASSLRSEYDLLRSLRHPSLVQAYRFEEFNGHSGLVMQLAIGRSLHCTVKSLPGPLCTAVVRRLSDKMLQGVSYIHGRGVVHRDLKPQNVVVTEDCSSVKIVDFGSAYLIGDNDGEEASLRAAATTLYAAPEQLLGCVGSRKSDVWSMGACLHFAVAGCLPQQRDLCETAEDLRGACELEVDLSESVCPEAPAECLTFLRRSMTLDARERPDSSVLLQDAWLRTATTRSESAESRTVLL